VAQGHYLGAAAGAAEFHPSEVAALRCNGEGGATEGRTNGEEPSCWQRLRRRKVVQWGIAYAATALAVLTLLLLLGGGLFTY
jgi:hypothetical protein